MNVNDVSNMLYSILVFVSACFGAWNLYLLIKLRGTDQECKRLKIENEELKVKLIECNYDKRTNG